MSKSYGDRSRGIRVVVLQPDPADEDGRVRRREGGVDLEVRRVSGEVGDVFDPQRLQIVGAERRTRGRRALEDVLPLAGDEDLLDIAGLLAHIRPRGLFEIRGIGFFEVGFRLLEIELLRIGFLEAALTVRRSGGFARLRRRGVLVGVDGILSRCGNDP